MTSGMSEERDAVGPTEERTYIRVGRAGEGHWRGPDTANLPVAGQAHARFRYELTAETWQRRLPDPRSQALPATHLWTVPGSLAVVGEDALEEAVTQDAVRVHVTLKREEVIDVARIHLLESVSANVDVLYQ